MASNKEIILNQYGDGAKEENRPGRSRSSSIEFHYTKKHLGPYITKSSKVLEVGCGTGYYGMYFADKCGEYHGVDLVPSHIEIFKNKIKESGFGNVSCSVGDAIDLSEIGDNSYDVVLCLGPLYHLPGEESEKAIKECRRVCRPDGIIAFSYINKIGLYAGACVDTDFEDFPNEETNRTVLKNGADPFKPGLYWYYTPEEIEAVVGKHDLVKISDYATDFYIFQKFVNRISDAKFETLMPLYDEIATHESCTGMGGHALLICRNGKS